MKTSSRKAKGRKLQKYICSRIADIFDLNYDQEDDNCAIHSREMGQSGTDVVLRGDLNKKFPFSVECKNTEKLNLYEAIGQAKSNQKNKFWLLVHKKNHKEPIAIMDWKTFEYLIRELKNDF